MGLVASKVTSKYTVWKTQRSRDLVLPSVVEGEPTEGTPKEGPSNLEIAKQVFEEEKKKMRQESLRAQEEVEKWKDCAEMHEDRLRKMIVNFDKSKKDKKRLNDEINKLEKKFKYSGLRASLGLPQDEQDKMKRELGIWKQQTGEAQKKVTQLESAAITSEARHLKEIKKLRAIIRNKQKAKEAQ